MQTVRQVYPRGVPYCITPKFNLALRSSFLTVADAVYKALVLSQPTHPHGSRVGFVRVHGMGWTRYFATGVTRDPLVKTREFAAYDVHSSVIRGFTHALTDSLVSFFLC